MKTDLPTETMIKHILSTLAGATPRSRSMSGTGQAARGYLSSTPAKGRNQVRRPPSGRRAATGSLSITKDRRWPRWRFRSLRDTLQGICRNSDTYPHQPSSPQRFHRCAVRRWALLATPRALNAVQPLPTAPPQPTSGNFSRAARERSARGNGTRRQPDPARPRECLPGVRIGTPARRPWDWGG